MFFILLIHVKNEFANVNIEIWNFNVLIVHLILSFFCQENLRVYFVDVLQPVKFILITPLFLWRMSSERSEEGSRSDVHSEFTSIGFFGFSVTTCLLVFLKLFENCVKHIRNFNPVTLIL